MLIDFWKSFLLYMFNDVNCYFFFRINFFNEFSNKFQFLKTGIGKYLQFFNDFVFSIVLLNCVLCIENIFGHFFQFFLVKMLQTFFNYWEWVLTLTPNIPRMHFSALRKIVGSHVLRSFLPSHSLKKFWKYFFFYNSLFSYTHRLCALREHFAHNPASWKHGYIYWITKK